MKRIIALALVLLMLFGLVACSKPKFDRVTEGSITFTKGNFPKIITVNNYYSSVVSLAQAVLGCSFEEAKEFVILAESADKAYTCFADGEGDMIIAAEPSDVSKAYLSDKAVALKTNNIAFDALAVVTGAANAVNALNIEQVASIYSGETVAWNELGGTETSIEAYPVKGDITKQLFDKYIAVNTDALIVPQRELVLENDTFKADQSFIATESSIGLILYSDFVLKSAHKTGNVKAFAVNGINLSDSTIKDGVYPFTLQINASVRDNGVVDYADILLNWLITPMGIEIIQKVGFLV